MMMTMKLTMTTDANRKKKRVHASYLRAREREVRRNEDYDAEAAERHNEVYRTVLCCLVLCIFCCMVVAFAALAFGLFGPGALVWIL